MHVPSFGPQYLSMSGHMSHLVYPVSHSERVEYRQGSSGGCTRADRRHSETYVTYVNEADGQ